MSDSVSIDKLTIEVESNATRAVDGIQKLANALGTLKTNGSFGTAVKNLNNLSDALKRMTPVTSNANKLSALAKSVNELSKVGSFARVVNQLSKLPDAMKGLSNLNIDNNLGAKLEKLAQATTPLANIKTGGLGTMINALGKIGDVTASLDDDTIGRFAERVEKLNTELTPLSTKMTTIQQGLRGINSSAVSASNGMAAFDGQVKTSRLNLANLITVVHGAVAALTPLIHKLSNAIGQAIEWDGISARFGRGFGNQANEIYAWIQRLNQEMGINIQQFMQYSSVFSTMLIGFGVGTEDAGKMALGYTELVYDIWAAYNDIYKSFADAADAVKSAIAGEVEPIRRAGFTITESMLKQTAANYGLEISLENATEAQKSYLRYLTLIDQAHAQGLVGAYASELNTAEGLMRTLSQQVKSLAQAFGSLFLPVLTTVIPWIQALVEVLIQAVQAIGAFFGFKVQVAGWSKGLGGIGSSADSAARSLGNAAGAAGSAAKAVEDLKDATLGIDELNVISPPTSPSGGGGGGGGGGGSAWDDLDIESLWDESIFNQIQDKVDDIKNKILNFVQEFETEIKIIGAALAALGVSKLLTHLGEALGLGDSFLKVMGAISKLAVTAIVITLQYTLMAELFESYINSGEFKDYVAALFVGALGTWVLYSMWGPAGLIIGLGITAVASLKAVFENGGITNVESAVVAFTGLASAVGAVSLAVKKLAPILASSKLGQYFAALIASLGGNTAGTSALTFIAPNLTKIGSALTGAAKSAGAFISGLSAGALALIAAAVLAVVSAVVFLKEHWDEVTAAVRRFWQENIVPKLESIRESFEKIKTALQPIIDVFKKIGDALKPAIDAIGEFISKIDILGFVGKIFEGIGFVVVEVVGGLIAGAFQAVMGIIDGFIQTIAGLVEIVSGFVKAVVNLFTGDLQAAKDACDEIVQGIVDVFTGLYKMTIGPIVDFVEGIIDWCVYLWDELVGHSIIPDTIDGIIKCFNDLPGKVLKTVTSFVTNTINEFKKFKPVQIAVGLAKSGWSTVSKWIGKIPSLSQLITLGKNGWTSVKNWIGSIPVVSQAVKLAKSGWSSVQNWIGKIPVLNAGIKLVKNGWSSVKNWLGNLNFNIGFRLPRIGVNWGTSSFAGFKISYPTGFYTYAKGGFPDIGELFIAREAGPEMVGKIGSKTTVANNQQIVESVSEGVYAAVLAAMRQSESNGGQAVNVYLDGRQITSAVEKRQHERGATIVNRAVYGY